MGMPLLRRLATFALGLAACAAESNIQGLLDGYYAAYDERATVFCSCFHALVGHSDPERCSERWVLTASQKGCIDGIFEARPDELQQRYSPASAIECLTATELDYAACIEALACDDVDGANKCINARNEAILECPRLSAADSEEFEKCRLL